MLLATGGSGAGYLIHLGRWRSAPLAMGGWASICSPRTQPDGILPGVAELDPPGDGWGAWNLAVAWCYPAIAWKDLSRSPHGGLTRRKRGCAGLSRRLCQAVGDGVECFCGVLGPHGPFGVDAPR